MHKLSVLVHTQIVKYKDKVEGKEKYKRNYVLIGEVRGTPLSYILINFVKWLIEYSERSSLWSQLRAVKLDFYLSIAMNDE